MKSKNVLVFDILICILLLATEDVHIEIKWKILANAAHFQILTRQEFKTKKWISSQGQNWSLNRPTPARLLHNRTVVEVAESSKSHFIFQLLSVALIISITRVRWRHMTAIWRRWRHYSRPMSRDTVDDAAVVCTAHFIVIIRSNLLRVSCRHVVPTVLHLLYLCTWGLITRKSYDYLTMW